MRNKNIFIAVVALAQLMVVACDQPRSDVLRRKASTTAAPRHETYVEAPSSDSRVIGSGDNENAVPDGESENNGTLPPGPPVVPAAAGRPILPPIPTDDELLEPDFPPPIGPGFPAGVLMGVCG